MARGASCGGRKLTTEDTEEECWQALVVDLSVFLCVLCGGNHMPIIETRDVTRVYQMGANEVVALNRVTMSAHEGEFVAIQGTSGSGKSAEISGLV